MFCDIGHNKVVGGVYVIERIVILLAIVDIPSTHIVLFPVLSTSRTCLHLFLVHLVHLGGSHLSNKIIGSNECNERR